MNGITEFIYKNVNLRYNPETGECWRQLILGRWKLITPGTGKYGYTYVSLGYASGCLHRILAEVFLNEGIPLTGHQHVDHSKPADGSHAQDKLSNLRIVSHQQNMLNQRLSSNNKSGYKGVSWSKAANKWQAQITSYGRRKCLGVFTTPEAAALAYDKAAKLLNGEFAKLNFNQPQ